MQVKSYKSAKTQAKKEYLRQFLKGALRKGPIMSLQSFFFVFFRLATIQVLKIKHEGLHRKRAFGDSEKGPTTLKYKIQKDQIPC